VVKGAKKGKFLGSIDFFTFYPILSLMGFFHWSSLFSNFYCF